MDWLPISVFLSGGPHGQRSLVGYSPWCCKESDTTERLTRASKSHSLMSDSLRPHGLYSPWNSPGQNTVVESLSFLQQIFLIQESNRGLLHCRQILYQLSYQGRLTHTHRSNQEKSKNRIETFRKPGDLYILLCCSFICYLEKLEFSVLGRKFLFRRYVNVCVHTQSLQLCQALCNPVVCSPPVSSVHGILQARILEWVAIPSSRGSSLPSIKTCVSCISCIAGRFFATEPSGNPDMWIASTKRFE